MKLHHLKKLARFALVSSFVFFSAYCARKQTADFTIDKITTCLPPHPEWEMPGTELDIHQEDLLKQTFTFFDQGGQSWVFLSADHQFVLKFFKFRLTWYDLFKNLWLPPFLEPYRPQLTEKQLHKLEQMLSGYALATQRFRESCALICTYLNGKSLGVHHITIVDKLGIKHIVDVKNKPFVLQRRVTPLMDVIPPLLREGKLEQAQRALSSALSLIAKRCAAQLRDEDHRLHKNIGYLEDSPVYLDAGAFILDHHLQIPDQSREEILRSAKILIQKIQEHGSL